MNIRKKIFLFYSNFLPLQIRTLKICNHDISKSMTARSFKLGHLIEDDKQILTLKICIHYISKTITTRSFKLGQLIEDDEEVNW